jgi:hypothetical protein
MTLSRALDPTGYESEGVVCVQKYVFIIMFVGGQTTKQAILKRFAFSSITEP